MKSIAICYSKHSIQISESYCSGSSKSKPSSSSLSQNLIPQVQNSVTCLYRSKIQNEVEEEEEEEDDDDDDGPILTSLTWTSNLIGRGFNIQITRNSTSCYDQLRKSRGSKTITIQSSISSRFEVKWDLSNAEYGNGPEPTSNFYVMVCKNSKPILFLGDYEEHKMTSPRYATFALVSRTESFSGSSLLCMTKAQFCDTGTLHDIVIKYVREEQENGIRDPMLIVSVDRKKVAVVKKLQWNFRGSQCVFVDGIVVDLMWDVHDWLFDPVSGNALFLFRTRSGLDSRLWLVKDERLKEKKKEEKQKLQLFSLLIIASKKHPN